MKFLNWLRGDKYVAEGRLTELDRDRAKAHWTEIEQQMKMGKPSNLQVAVMEADKAVDELLRVLYPQTETMGERLKLAKSLFKDWKTYDNLWYAHKVRNALVHEANIDLPSHEAISVLEKFHDGMQEIINI